MDGRATIAAIMLSGFGLFLIWKGVSGDVMRLSDGRAFIPRWLYILGGCVVLILPMAYLAVHLIVLFNAE